MIQFGSNSDHLWYLNYIWNSGTNKTKILPELCFFVCLLGWFYFILFYFILFYFCVCAFVMLLCSFCFFKIFMAISINLKKKKKERKKKKKEKRPTFLLSAFKCSFKEPIPNQSILFGFFSQWPTMIYLLRYLMIASNFAFCL